MAARATAFLAGVDELLLPDLVVAEMVYVLESFYEVPAGRVAELLRSVIAFAPIRTIDPALLLRALEVYEIDRIEVRPRPRVKLLLGWPSADRCTPASPLCPTRGWSCRVAQRWLRRPCSFWRVPI